MVYYVVNAAGGAYMRRMRNGTVYMELNQTSKDKGYTMRSVINPDAIRAFKRWNKESAAIIRDAIRRGDYKTVIREVQNAKWRNRTIREYSEQHDKIVYDAVGNAIFWWDCKEQKMYGLEAQ